MSSRAPRAVVVDTMAVSALGTPPATRSGPPPTRRAINDDAIVVSFVTITELRFGALRAGWENCAAADSSATSPSWSSSNPTTSSCGSAPNYAVGAENPIRVMRRACIRG